MPRNNKATWLMLLGLIVFTILAACGVVKPEEKANIETPDTLKLHSKYYNTDVDEHIYEGCEYISVDNGYRTWGSHKGNCKNHPQSLNEEYNPAYKIFGVETKTYGTYKVHYTCKGDTAQFIGNMEACMAFGFDLNDVVLWSNL